MKVSIRSARLCVVALVLAGCADDALAPPPSNRSTDGGRSDSGAGDASQSDAADGPRDYGPTCFGFDPRAVHLKGEEGEDYPNGVYGHFALLAPHASTDARCYNFETGEAAQIRPDGRLIYIASWWIRPQRALHLLVPDDYDAETGERTRHADEVVPTPGCDASTRGVRHFLLDPRDGEAYYDCLAAEGVDVDGPNKVYDTRGEVFYVGNLLAIGGDGTLLVSDGYGELQVRRGPDAELIELIFPDDAVLRKVAAMRAVPGGIWLALRASDVDDTFQRSAELALVRASGDVERIDRYADAPEDLRRPSSVALDADGDLYEIRWTGTTEFQDVVLRRPRGGAPPEVVFDEGEQPDGGLRPDIGDYSYLITAP